MTAGGPATTVHPVTAPHRTDRGLDRFATFVDAVVAIAITLLVLPLVDVAGEREPGQSVGALLGDHLGQFAAFALSFVVIARLWLVHHAVSERVGAYDAVVVRSSLLWVFTIVVLPFPTELLPLADGGRTVFALYVGDLTLSSLALTVLVLHVARTPAVQRAGCTPGPARPPRWWRPACSPSPWCWACWCRRSGSGACCCSSPPGRSSACGNTCSGAWLRVSDR